MEIAVRLGATAVVTLVLGVAGCRPGAGAFSERACSAESFSLVDGLLPTFEFAELRETGGPKGPARTLGAAGEKCKSAKDKSSCEVHVTEASATSGFSNGSHGRLSGYRFLVATRGDEVVVIDGRTKTVGAALAPIDTPAKAAAAAYGSRDIVPKCGGSVRRAGKAFEVHLTSDSCFGPVDEIVSVANDGTVSVVTSERGSATCVGALPLDSTVGPI